MRKLFLSLLYPSFQKKKSIILFCIVFVLYMYVFHIFIYVLTFMGELRKMTTGGGLMVAGQHGMATMRQLWDESKWCWTAE